MTLLFLGSLSFGYAQFEKPKDSLWIKEGKVNVLLNQATFGEWLGGGTNNFNGIINLDYLVHRKHENWDWTTTLDASLGFAKTEASDFYKVHQSKPFYDDLCTYLSSGPIIVIILEGENAVAENRKLMGSTNPKDAEDNTIRKLFGISIDKNSVHGSDSIENAKEEINFFFKN